MNLKSIILPLTAALAFQNVTTAYPLLDQYQSGITKHGSHRVDESHPVQPFDSPDVAELDTHRHLDEISGIGSTEGPELSNLLARATIAKTILDKLKPKPTLAVTCTNCQDHASDPHLQLDMIKERVCSRWWGDTRLHQFRSAEVRVQASDSTKPIKLHVSYHYPGGILGRKKQDLEEIYFFKGESLLNHNDSDSCNPR